MKIGRLNERIEKAREELLRNWFIQHKGFGIKRNYLLLKGGIDKNA